MTPTPNADLTRPENVSTLSANVNMPTREEVARAICLHRAAPACECKSQCRAPAENLLHESNERLYQADAILARFAPALAAAEKRGMERAAVIAEDEDGAITTWGMDKNTAVAQRTAKDISDAIRAEMEKM